MRYLRLRLSPAVVTPHPDVTRGAVLNSQFRDDGTLLELYRLEGDRTEIVAGLDQDSSIIEYETFDADGDQFFLLQHGRPNDSVRELLTVLRDHKLAIVLPIRFAPESGVVAHVVGKTERLRDAYAAFPDEIKQHTTIEQVGEYVPEAMGILSALTARQREILEAALEAGYYSVPREGTAEDVAEQAGCAPSTAAEHLRKIEAKVMSRLFEEMGSFV